MKYVNVARFTNLNSVATYRILTSPKWVWVFPKGISKEFYSYKSEMKISKYTKVFSWEGGGEVCRYSMKFGWAKKNFGGSWAVFRRRGHFMLKMNKTFFITNLVLNIFMLNNFFGKSVFSEKTAKNCSEGTQLEEPKRTNFWPTLLDQEVGWRSVGAYYNPGFSNNGKRNSKSLKIGKD